MQFERMPTSGQLKLILSETMARKVVQNYNYCETIWYLEPYYKSRFIQLFQKAYGNDFRCHGDFYSINMNTLIFFFWIGGRYYIQLSTDNNETDDEYFVASLLESLLKN